MAFSSNTILNNKKFTISKEIKSFSLRDFGFIQNPNSNIWQYIGILQPELGEKKSFKLKIAFNSSLDGFKLNVVNANENRNINLEKIDDPTAEEQFNFIIESLKEKNILEVENV
ncbi:MAG: DUF1831 domain-containing protein [Lactobacillaceae bacterium]|jgi:hypothetical protein|nr:DUF1831 domain-containing protein [Lactobacillaceae bacterium]